MEWMLLPLKRYAQFSGRSRRKEYWMWVLFVVVTMLVLSLLDSILGLGGRTTVGPGATPDGFAYGAGVNGGLLTGIFLLGVLIPNLAVAVRRLHDVDRSGWWILLPMLPYLLAFIIMIVGAFTLNAGLVFAGGMLLLVGFICAIVVFVWSCMPGTNGPNRFGADPKSDTPEHLARTFE